MTREGDLFWSGITSKRSTLIRSAFPVPAQISQRKRHHRGFYLQPGISFGLVQSFS